MNYLRGPWVWNGTRWRPPAWAAHAIDMRPHLEQAQAGGTPGLGLFGTNLAVADSNYDLIASGDWREIKTDSRMRDTLPQPKNKKPNGDTLAAMVYDLLTECADPAGIDFVRPIVPGRRFEVHLGGMFTVPFIWGNQKTNKVRDVLRNKVKKAQEEVEAGRADEGHPARVVDYLCHQYGINDLTQFVPPELQGTITKREKHHTEYVDDFNRADDDLPGASAQGWSWAEVVPGGDADIVSNQLSFETQSLNIRLRAEANLSSDNHSTRIMITGMGSGADDIAGGPIARFSPTLATFYLCYFWQFDDNYYLGKYVNGTPTDISWIPIVPAPSPPEAFRINCVNSTISAHQGGEHRFSVTDSEITGNVRTGLTGYRAPAIPLTMDDYLASDVALGTAAVLFQSRRSRSV